MVRINIKLFTIYIYLFILWMYIVKYKKSDIDYLFYFSHITYNIHAL